MKSYHHILSKVYGEPWLITAQKHQAIRDGLQRALSGVDPMAESVEEVAQSEIDGNVMVIPVHGIIGQHLSGMEVDCGGCSLDQVRQDIETAETDAQIQFVIFDFRSPGGTVTGVPEIADEIKALGLSKETVAFTDDQCCSAALWMASQCNQFFCTPSASVGSVGVYSVYADESVSLTQKGIKINEIASGKYKLSGAPWRAMTDTERGMFQSSCDAIYANFKAAILDNRDVADEDMQGQCFNGADALEKGLVDGLAPSLEDLLDYLTAD